MSKFLIELVEEKNHKASHGCAGGEGALLEDMRSCRPFMVLGVKEVPQQAAQLGRERLPYHGLREACIPPAQAKAGT